MQLVGKFCFGLAGVCLLVVGGLFNRKGALRLSDGGLCLELCGFASLLGFRSLNGGVPVGVGLSDCGVSLDLCRSTDAQRLEVALFVLNVSNREADDLQAHVRHVGRGYFSDLIGESSPVLVDVFNAHCAQYGALVSF